MMQIRMVQLGRPAELDEVRGLERAVGRPLPRDYTDFLLMQNGGRPDPARLVLPQHPAGTCEIESFYGLGSDLPWHTLWWGLEAHRDAMPEGFLPIAYTDQGHEICLLLRDDDFGGVVLWDGDWECGKDCWDNVYDVADSFVEFLALLANGRARLDPQGRAPMGPGKLH